MLNIQDLIAVSGLAVGTIISVVSLIFQRKQVALAAIQAEKEVIVKLTRDLANDASSGLSKEVREYVNRRLRPSRLACRTGTRYRQQRSPPDRQSITGSP